MALLKSPEDIKTIAIIGAGTMGHGIAQIVALSGRQARVFDHDKDQLNALESKVRANLASFVEAGLVEKEAVEPAIARLAPCPTLAEAVQDALALAKEANDLHTGDQVVVISGQSTQTLQTDTLQLMRVP